MNESDWKEADFPNRSEQTLKTRANEKSLIRMDFKHMYPHIHYWLQQKNDTSNSGWHLHFTGLKSGTALQAENI